SPGPGLLPVSRGTSRRSPLARAVVAVGPAVAATEEVAVAGTGEVAAGANAVATVVDAASPVPEVNDVMIAVRAVTATTARTGVVVPKAEEATGAIAAGAPGVTAVVVTTESAAAVMTPRPNTVPSTKIEGPGPARAGPGPFYVLLPIVRVFGPPVGPTNGDSCRTTLMSCLEPSRHLKGIACTSWTTCSPTSTTSCGLSWSFRCWWYRPCTSRCVPDSSSSGCCRRCFESCAAARERPPTGAGRSPPSRPLHCRRLLAWVWAASSG